MLARHLASDQGITRQKVHLFEGLCKNPQPVLLPHTGWATQPIPSYPRLLYPVSDCRAWNNTRPSIGLSGLAGV